MSTELALVKKNAALAYVKPLKLLDGVTNSLFGSQGVKFFIVVLWFTFNYNIQCVCDAMNALYSYLDDFFQGSPKLKEYNYCPRDFNSDSDDERACTYIGDTNCVALIGEGEGT